MAALSVNAAFGVAMVDSEVSASKKGGVQRQRPNIEVVRKLRVNTQGGCALPTQASVTKLVASSSIKRRRTGSCKRARSYNPKYSIGNEEKLLYSDRKVHHNN